MADAYATVQRYVQALQIDISHADDGEQLLVLEAEEKGLRNLVLDCEDEILVIEQLILQLDTADAQTYRTLLQINRDLVHGALCLDETGERVIFRDTLQLANLDLNELEASINALSLMLAENATTFIKLAREQGAAA